MKRAFYVNKLLAAQNESSYVSTRGLVTRRDNALRTLLTSTCFLPATTMRSLPPTTMSSCQTFLSFCSSSSSLPQDHLFPSLLIKRDSVEARGGAFAQATAMYLDPDPVAVQELSNALQRTSTAIVAHYYMDVELQGVLTAVLSAASGKNIIGIADSLKMGDMAVDMAKHSNIKQVICLGVDFMAESVQAILNKNGFPHIPVYRADARKIGCSLAESAETETYRAWLQKESVGSMDPALHMIYINTSLETKAVSSSLVPTITCTSSNVLQTMLQAAFQMPQLKVLYGPDTYMGRNLKRLLQVVSENWTNEQIAQQLHPHHSQESLRQLYHNLHVYPSGNCIVHHMFGSAVVEKVQQYYQDCYVTAHLEVPGEMFEVAMNKSLTDKGVVGSTSSILHFIQRKVQEAVDDLSNNKNTSNGNNSHNRLLRFILGTEAGMVTSIVKSVQQILRQASAIEVEIIFPVAAEAVTATGDASLQLVPGVPASEGCSTAGGCATCPFMKMNDLDAVMDLLTLIEQQQQKPQQQQEATKAQNKLKKHLPPDRLSGRQINGQAATDLGSEAILFMREFMKDKQIPGDLCEKVMKSVRHRELLNRS